MTWLVEPLDATHERDGFQSGLAPLDEYIRRLAGQHTRKDFGRTYVAVTAESRQVEGYYTLSASSVTFAEVPASIKKKLPRYPIPVALLGKLAVDQSVQGQGLGQFLLIDALRRIVAISEQMAIFAVEVHAKDETERSFYRKFGFQTFQDQPLHLFLPIATIRQLF